MSIQKIVSKKVDLPVIYLIENEGDYKQIPLGIPYILGHQSELPFIRIFLEFQTLYKSCLKTGIPIKWLDCLKKIGYNPSNIKNYKLQSGGEYWSSDTDVANTISVDDFIEDSYFVDFDKLSDLKILPVWLEDLKSSIETNIINEVTFDPTAFNKQLGMNIGAGAVKTHKKNLLILDISGSIPDSIRLTIIQLSKLMSKRFYADVIFTGGSTVFLDYEDVMTKNITDITDKISRSNEGEQFRRIVEQHKEYNTCISFGDDDSPQAFSKVGELKPNFQIETLYSLHTKKDSDDLTGYCKCFKPKTTIKIKDWVQTVNK